MKLSKILFSAVIPFFTVASDLSAIDPDDDADEPTRRRVRQSFISLPLRFEENTGHLDAQVKYLARGPGYTLFLTPTETVLSTAKDHSRKRNIVRVRLDKANTKSTLCGESKLSAPTTYLIGNDSKKWHAAANYERVRCASVYPGVDLVYHGKQQKLEYDFEVAPGADPRSITLRYDGVRELRTGKDGSLVLRLRDGGELRQNRPVAYQLRENKRHEITSHYLVKPGKKVAFGLGKYDASLPLVIDPPVLDYSSYLGGNSTESILGIAVGPANNVYVVGQTDSTNFPAQGQYQGDQTGTDVFVARFDTSMSGAASLIYSTYLGGNGSEQGQAIATDSSGHAFVAGYTESTDFPMFNQYQANQADRDVFVTELDTNASGAASLLYSTYLGGNGEDIGYGIAVGVQGNIFVTGSTESTDFPILNQYQSDQTTTDAFVTKLDPTASGAASLVYSTYFGGSGGDFGRAIAVDETGRVYVTGYTSSSNFPKLHEYQGRQAGFDIFLAKLNPLLAGAAGLVYSTYFGGSGDDIAYGLAVDSGHTACLTGYTDSTNFPRLNEYQGDQGGRDAFASQFDPDATGAASLLYSTYLGGSGSDTGNGIAVTSNGTAYIAGFTDSTDYPTQDPLQTDLGGTDAFVTKINPNMSGASSFVFSTYLAGSSTDIAQGIAIDSANDVYVAGWTGSTNFPLLHQYQSDQTSSDGFITKYQTGPLNEACANAIPVALNEVVIGKTGGAVNDYQLSGGACFTGFGQVASAASGRDVIYSFVAPTAGNYSFRVSNYNGGGDPVLYVASSCPAAGGSPVIVNTCLGASNRTAPAGPYTSEEVMCLPLTSGQQVFIFVDEDTFVPGGTFVLEVNQCFSESEANDTPGTADPLNFGLEGSINPFTDVDFFSLGISGTNVNARVFALVDGRAASNKDFDLRVTTTTDTLEFDNQDTDLPFGDLSPTIAGTPLTGASTFLRIVTNTPPTGSEPYRLYAVVQPPGAGLGNSSATAESEPNGTIAQADSATNNFFSGSLAGPAPSNDIDYFSFTAEAGDLIFLSLDADPLRNNTPIDAKLALLDANGALLLQVNDGNSNSNTASGVGSLGATTPRSPAESLIYRATETGTYYAGVAIGTTSPTAIGAGDYLLSIATDFRLVSAVSRKTHAGTPFDIPLPLTGTPGIECRSGGGGGNHTLILTFNNDVVSGTPSVTAGTGNLGTISLFSNVMSVGLTGVTDQQTVTVTLSGVTDRLSRVLPNFNVSMIVLLGDTTANKSVNASDVSQTKSRSGAVLDTTNFRSDTNVNGSVNASDVSQVKSNSGHGVP